MIRLKASIRVAKDVAYVFRYTSDFRHIQEWDPGVVSSLVTHRGKNGLGSKYDLVLKFGPFRPKMRYEIIAYTPFSRVVLKGEGESFTAIDTIVFSRTAGGTQIDYQADIRFLGLGRTIEKILFPIMKKTGENAMAGLEQKLAGTPVAHIKKMWFKSGACLPDYIADHLIVPGMTLFSRFGYLWTRKFQSESKGTLYGKKIVLTGGTSGIGKAAAFKLAEKNAFLTIVARNRAKAEQVCREMVEKTGNPHIDFLIADLGLMQDVRRVAQRIKASKKRIDILINNAGALFTERKLTPEGLEQTFATDLLGVFLLTQYLKDALAPSKSGRIINVSSGGMYTQKINVNDLENSQGEYNGAKAYARAKRGIVILTQIWAEQFKMQGIRVNAMHPG